MVNSTLISVNHR